MECWVGQTWRGYRIELYANNDGNCETQKNEDFLRNKNAFQWDAYHPLVDRIPACTAKGRGLYPSMHWARGCVSQHALGRGVSALGVSAQGGCLPGGVCLWSQRGCLPRALPGRGVSASGPRGVWHTPPVKRMTDRCKNITLPQLRCGR